MSEWGARHIIGKLISACREQWAHRARERRAIADAVLATRSSIASWKARSVDNALSQARAKLDKTDLVIRELQVKRLGQQAAVDSG